MIPSCTASISRRIIHCLVCSYAPTADARRRSLPSGSAPRSSPPGHGAESVPPGRWSGQRRVPPFRHRLAHWPSSSLSSRFLTAPRRPQLPLPAHPLAHRQVLQLVLHRGAHPHQLLPMLQPLPPVALLWRRNPDTSKQVGPRQIQDVFGIPAVRLLPPHRSRPNPRCIPEPQFVPPVPSASARTSACNPWLQFPLAPHPANGHKKLGLLRSRVPTAASLPHRSSYPASQFAGSAYANHIR